MNVNVLHIYGFVCVCKASTYVFSYANIFLVMSQFSIPRGTHLLFLEH